MSKNYSFNASDTFFFSTVSQIIWLFSNGTVKANCQNQWSLAFFANVLHEEVVVRNSYEWTNSVVNLYSILNTSLYEAMKYRALLYGVWLKFIKSHLFFLLDPVTVLPELGQDDGGVEPEEDTERQANPLKDDPGCLSEELNLIRSCVDLQKKLQKSFYHIQEFL